MMFVSCSNKVYKNRTLPSIPFLVLASIFAWTGDVIVPNLRDEYPCMSIHNYNVDKYSGSLCIDYPLITDQQNMI